MKEHDKIRIVIVEDSAFMRKIIADILMSDPDMEIVGKARDGNEAMEVIRSLLPDVVTLDIEMPGKSGIEVLQEIMKFKPIPVVMVSSLAKYGADVTLQALDMGAVDFVTKPSGNISMDMSKVAAELVNKVKAASRASICGGIKKRISRSR